MPSVKTECRACQGTGLRQGFAEPKGTAVVCLGCDGSGCEVIKYKTFTHINLKRGVSTVRLSRGTFIGVRPADGDITYAEFRAGKKPGVK